MKATTPVMLATADYFQVPVGDLLATSRLPKAVVPRHVAWYLERELGGRSFAAIGKLYDRDHSSVVVAYRHVVERVAAADERYAPHVAVLAKLIGGAEGEHLRTAASVAARAEEVRETARAEALACPTCGAPVVRELQRQVADLSARLVELERGREKQNPNGEPKK